MNPLELETIREIFSVEDGGVEGFTLGRIFADNVYVGYTLEDEDRHLESIGKEGKVYGKTAIPCGRYEVVLYDSPKHGVVPLLLDVPGYSYVEIHGANHSRELLGCIAVGKARTADGVATCSVVVNRIVSLIERAADDGRKTFITVKRFGD